MNPCSNKTKYDKRFSCLQKNKKNYIKKGFTTKEIIVVLVIISIMGILIIPRFLSQKAEANLSRIKDDTMIVGAAVNEYLAKNDKLPNSWEIKKDNELRFDLVNKDIYSSEGKVSDIAKGNYRKIDLEIFKERSGTKLKGEFIANEQGDTYYIQEIEK